MELENNFKGNNSSPFSKTELVMNTKARITVAIASLILILTFFFPIWQISLQAPQYPEGLGLNIWINKITGENYHNLESINGLNHYIGMKAITVDSIPELKIMPYIIIFLIFFGLLAAVTGKKKLVEAWIAMFIILAIAGLVDFYMWEYNYGHNLSTDAPIKIPGMSYQPPLIGSQKLLNITATSLPFISSFVIFISIAMSVVSLFMKSKEKVNAK